MSIVEKIQHNPIYNKLAQPIIDNGGIGELRDAELYLRRDGLIVNAEGWCHPPHMLVGEVLYTPDIKGDRTIFGQQYRKVSLFPNTHTPVPYGERAKILAQLDPQLDQTQSNPFFARYKQIFNRADFIAHFPSRKTLQTVLAQLVLPQDEIMLDIENLEKLLGINVSQMSLGLTGAPLLGNFRGYHDLDLVFQGSTVQNLDIARKMRDLVKYESKRRLTEGGKGWNIRFFNDRGKLMCNFFGYMSPQEAPLIDFEMQVLQDDIQVEGTVSDDTHTIYTPTILGLRDVIITRIKESKMSERANDIPLIIYHTASRGECFSGDRIRARGALTRVYSSGGSHEAICVKEREGVRNLTPTWEGYYQD